MRPGTQIRLAAGSLRGLQVLRRASAAAAVLNDIEIELLAFDDGAHACALHGGDMDEHVRLSAVLLDEAETLGGVEELDRSGVHDDFLSNRIEIRRPAGCRTSLVIEIEKENRKRRSAVTKFVASP